MFFIGLWQLCLSSPQWWHIWEWSWWYAYHHAPRQFIMVEDGYVTWSMVTNKARSHHHTIWINLQLQNKYTCALFLPCNPSGLWVLLSPKQANSKVSESSIMEVLPHKKYVHNWPLYQLADFGIPVLFVQGKFIKFYTKVELNMIFDKRSSFYEECRNF